MAALQNTPTNERLSRMDILRYKICQGSIIKNGFADMLANRQETG
jgi:hypothetical protein